MNYYYVDTAGATIGPVTGADLMQRRRDGGLQDGSPVIPEGGSEWLTFAQCLPSYPSVAPVPSPPPSTPQPQRQPEEVVREHIATAGAYGRAIAGVLGETADRIATQIADQANRGLAAGESRGDGTAAAFTAAARVERIGVAATFGCLLAIGLLAPIGTIQGKVGQPAQVTTLKMIAGMGSFNLWALLAILSPAVGLVVAYFVRRPTWRWICLVAAFSCMIATQQAFTAAVAAVQLQTHSVTDIEVSTWMVFIGPVSMLVGIYLLIAASVSIIRSRPLANTAVGST